MKLLIVLLALAAANAELRFGFPGFDTRGLNDDLAAIIGLVPVDEIRAVAREYIAADAQVQDVFRYLQGPEWGGLVATVAGNPAWGRFKDFCLENGVDVDDIVGRIHDLINGVDVPATGGDIGGVRSLIDAIRELIPGDALLAEIDNLLSNSASFQDFYGFISSEAARDFLNEILDLPETQDIIGKLYEFGIDVDAIIAFIRDFLGWSRIYYPGVPLEYM